MPADFFTWGALGTLAAASGAVVVVSNTVRRFTRLTGPVVPFVVSLLITFGGGARSHALGDWDWSDWVITFLNSCLLFCTATGAQETVVAGAQGQAPSPLQPHGAKPTPFWSSWVRN
jgi:hypothetical protein